MSIPTDEDLYHGYEPPCGSKEPPTNPGVKTPNYCTDPHCDTGKHHSQVIWLCTNCLEDSGRLSTSEETKDMRDHELYNIINNKLTEVLKCMQNKANTPAPSCPQWNCRGNSQAAALFPHIADLNYCSECCNKQNQALADLIEPPGVPKWTPVDDIAYSKQWDEEEQLLRDQAKKLKQAIAMGIGDMRVQLIAGPGINLEVDAAVNDKLSQVMEMVINGDFDYYVDIIREQTNAKH